MTMSLDYPGLLTGFKSRKFKTLWPAQDHVLKKYFEEFIKKPDVAIELPTGAGKTLIALLIAESWRRDSKKVAILSANKTLARQMEMESQQLGIPAVLMEGPGTTISSSDRRHYHRANKIAIMNYWVYFNQRPVIDNADLVIMDDAHLAEHCLHSLYSVEIDRSQHNSLFISLVKEIVDRFPEYTVLQDALEESPSTTMPPELLSFIDQVDIGRRLREIIDASPLLETDEDLKFRWTRLRNSLNEANIYLSLNSIWIRPYIYPLITNSHYADASQKIYMSATIGEPSDLCRRLGTMKIEKIPIPSHFAEATSGRRFIVINRMEDMDVPERVKAAIVTALRKRPKSVWMCTSKTEASKLRIIVSELLGGAGFVGHQTWVLSSLGNEIDQFKRAENGHLFVAGRFDGMDFQGDECRLVVLTTLPKSINIQEEFVCAYLRDTGFMKRRLNQRIIQALGRCNRSTDDYAVYVLADKRFATHFGRESNRQGIPRNIMAEIDMAEDMAETDVDDLIKKLDTFLAGDFSEFDSTFQKMASGISSSQQSATAMDLVEDEVLGWVAMFGSQNYSIAAQKFESCWQRAREQNLIELGAYYGWCWAKAQYLGSLQSDSGVEEALLTLEAAINRGGNSSWFNRLKASLNRAQNRVENLSIIATQEYSNAVINSFDKKLEELGTRSTRFQRWCNRLTDELQSTSHDQYRQGLCELGELLGYESNRPAGSGVPDCIWRGIFGNLKEVFTFEVKIEDTPSGKITFSDVGQVHNHITQAKAKYESFGYTIRGSFVSHLVELMPDAETSAGEIRVIPKNVVMELWQIVKQLLIQYRTIWSLDDMNLRRSSAEVIRPRIASSSWLIGALNSDNRVITADELLSSWRT